MGILKITKTCEQCGLSFHPSSRSKHPSRFCSRQCYELGRSRPLSERLNDRIRKTDDPGNCWLWSGPVNNKGYGTIGIGGRNGKHALAHRAAWEQVNGRIPDGMGALHRCDTPRCCNPSHLFLGTQTDNMRDASRKGRVGHGTRHWNARLTDSAIREIRASTETHQAIADRYGVTRPLISKIRNRENWRHVD